MKTFKNLFIIILFGVLITSCDDGLDLEPLDRITANDLFSDPEGVKLYLADLYDRSPIEDLTYFPISKGGFNYNPGDPNNTGVTSAMLTQWAQHSESNRMVNGDVLNWWNDAFSLIRDVNLFFEIIPTLEVSEEEKQLLAGEASFIRAFAYFGLVKRYGGVPIFTEPQVFEGDIEVLKVPRNTEEETWDFIMSECDVAISNLGDSNGRRASKWAALALKSRAALHAASIAKFGDNISLQGPAVEQKLIGLPSSAANKYYQLCIDASEEIMDNGPYSLYKPNPVSVEEAAENYRAMFENPNIAPEEAILVKGRTIPGTNFGNNYDIWYGPAQLRNGWPHPGRYNPTLEFVDRFESYDNPGQDAPIVTTVDGNIFNYDGYDPSREYFSFTNPTDIFEGKDARLQATVILPFSEWKDTQIVIQAGFIDSRGNPKIETNSRTRFNGQLFFTYGSSDPELFSGFSPLGGNHTKTGFGFKKFLSTTPVVPAWNQSTTDYAEFRYAEVLLNYAEAVVESGLGDEEKAKTALNATRKRAFHQTEIDLTVDNVQRERTVELSFENKMIWDLMRRRTYHTTFNNTRKHGLKPVLDLTKGEPLQYIFVRGRLRGNSPQTFDEREYYRNIPGIGLNDLVPNP